MYVLVFVFSLVVWTFQMIEIDPESEEVFPGITNMANELRVRVDTSV